MANQTPARIPRLRARGWNMPADTIYVGRPTPWGNYCGSVKEFEEFARKKAATDLSWLAPLRGKNLSCWCSIDQPCHADILLLLANL